MLVLYDISFKVYTTSIQTHIPKKRYTCQISCYDWQLCRLCNTEDAKVSSSFVLQFRSCRFASQVQAALKAQGSLGFDIILDAVSGEYFKPGFEALAPGGRYVVYGAANWTPTGRSLTSLMAGRVLSHFNLIRMPNTSKERQCRSPIHRYAISRVNIHAM